MIEFFYLTRPKIQILWPLPTHSSTRRFLQPLKLLTLDIFRLDRHVINTILPQVVRLGFRIVDHLNVP